MLIVLGIILIPGIYAWLNIDSNWGPYDNTGNIPIAVVNKDTGAEILGETVNLGGEIEDSLKKNDAMRWTFTDESEAVAKVESSEYYGAIIIPEDFSERLTSILESTEIKKPAFDFYVNNKKNPIAPIIVNKAVGAVQDSVNQAFVNTVIFKTVETVKDADVLGQGADIASGLVAKLNEVKAEIEQLKAVMTTTGMATKTTSQSLVALRGVMPALDNITKATEQSVNETKNAINSLGEKYKVIEGDASAKIGEAETKVEGAIEVVDQLDPSGTVPQLEIIRADLERTLTGLEQIDSSLKTFGEKLQFPAEIEDASQIVASLSEAMRSVDLSLVYMISALDNGGYLTEDVNALLSDFQSSLDKVIASIEEIKKNDLYNVILNLLSNEPETIADFISTPVEAHEIEVYPVASYGSEMAPFYSILACWVGCTVLSAIVKVDVKRTKITAKAKNYQVFFGRFMLFGILAMLQGLFIGIGDLILQVQTVNVPAFLATLMFASLVFATIIYALVAVFGKVGQAISIVIMVLQVAGSGGTFPIELLPRAFQVLQPFMPFYPAMNATRETIGGFYQNDYIGYILMLACHAVLMMAIGLALSKYTAKTKEKLQKELHKTGVIG